MHYVIRGLDPTPLAHLFEASGRELAAGGARPVTADDAIRDLFAHPDTAYIHAHDAAMGCFLANVERDL